jgi:PAS domain-containing protein
MSDLFWDLGKQAILLILGVLSGWIGAVRQHRRDDFRTILEERSRQFLEQKDEIERLRNLVQKMELRIDGLEAARDDFPFPTWQVDRNGECIHVNRHFIDRFLTPNGKTPSDVLGKRHEDIWPAAVASHIRSLTNQAMRSPDHKARYDNVDMQDGSSASITLLKIPDYSRSTLVGFTIYAIDVPTSAIV